MQKVCRINGKKTSFLTNFLRFCNIEKNRNLLCYNIHGENLGGYDMKYGKVIPSLLITGVFASSSILPNVYAETTQEKLNSIQSQLSETNKNLHMKEAEKEQLQKEIDQLTQQMRQFDEQIEANQQALEKTQADIEKTKQLIEQKKQNIAHLEAKIQQRQELLKKRLVSLQLEPRTNLVTEVLINTKSMAELVGNIYSLSLIFESDTRILEELKEDQVKLKQEKNIVETQEQALRSYEEELKKKQQELESIQKQKQDALQTMEQKLGQTLAEIVSEEEAQRILKAQAAAASEELARQKAAEAAAQVPAKQQSVSKNPTVSAPAKAGGFIKPAAGAYTSGFGPRWGKNHDGVDIAAPGTVPVVAAASGTVIQSYYSTSYGNVIFISHNINGKPYTTVYAHLRSRSVSAGQTVQQGQQIGIMGNTGASKGQHLHFEIHAGGWNAGKTNAVDPMPYLN
jgi:murein DD-endopeptidase MepM/ murein hydrolase activator NlpD